jgi:hypothetical protein
MREAEKLFEAEVIRLSDTQWCWCARGVGLEEYCRRAEPELLQAFESDGWLYVGPFRSERTAARNCKQFERESMQACGAPDPRLMN